MKSEKMIEEFRGSKKGHVTYSKNGKQFLVPKSTILWYLTSKSEKDSCDRLRRFMSSSKGVRCDMKFKQGDIVWIRIQNKKIICRIIEIESNTNSDKLTKSSKYQSTQSEKSELNQDKTRILVKVYDLIDKSIEVKSSRDFFIDAVNFLGHVDYRRDNISNKLILNTFNILNPPVDEKLQGKKIAIDKSEIVFDKRNQPEKVKTPVEIAKRLPKKSDTTGKLNETIDLISSNYVSNPKNKALFSKKGQNIYMQDYLYLLDGSETTNSIADLVFDFIGSSIIHTDFQVMNTSFLEKGLSSNTSLHQFAYSEIDFEKKGFILPRCANNHFFLLIIIINDGDIKTYSLDSLNNFHTNLCISAAFIFKRAFESKKDNKRKTLNIGATSRVETVPQQSRFSKECCFFMIQNCLDVLDNGAIFFKNPSNVPFNGAAALLKRREISNFVYDQIPNPQERELKRVFDESYCFILPWNARNNVDGIFS